MRKSGLTEVDLPSAQDAIRKPVIARTGSALKGEMPETVAPLLSQIALLLFKRMEPIEPTGFVSCSPQSVTFRDIRCLEPRFARLEAARVREDFFLCCWIPLIHLGLSWTLLGFLSHLKTRGDLPKASSQGVARTRVVGPNAPCRCFVAALPPALLLLCCCSAAALLLLCCCSAAAMLLLCCCSAAALLMLCCCSAGTLPLL